MALVDYVREIIFTTKFENRIYFLSIKSMSLSHVTIKFKYKV